MGELAAAVLENGGAAAAVAASLAASNLDAYPSTFHDSEDELDEGDMVTEEELRRGHTDELARRLAAQKTRTLQRIERMRHAKKRLKVELGSYKQKEKQYVAQMDTHMDEVERAEQELSSRIEVLTADSQQLREENETQSRENQDVIDRLSETTKQCGESETRVQFLVDRIVALLSARETVDPAQTEAVLSLRQRERDMLRQLEDTRQQFDEVRQQNCEITGRLTEELSLSKRLSEQLAEVEERFMHRPDGAAGRVDGEAGARLGPRLDTRSLGARSELEIPVLPVRREREHPPDMPPPIREDEVEDDESFEADSPAANAADFSFGDHAAAAALARHPPQHGDGADEASPLRHVPEEDVTDAEPRAASQWLEMGLQPSASRSALMEAKLRDALDRAAFECAVVRLETGVYSFGPSAQAVRVKLSEGEEVVASQAGGPFVPIDDFIAAVAAAVAGDAPEDSSVFTTVRGAEVGDDRHGASTEEAEMRNTEAMECKLRDALSAVAFECSVNRLQPGIYQFGPDVLALVHLVGEELCIARCDSEGLALGPSSPAETFLRDVMCRREAVDEEPRRWGEDRWGDEDLAAGADDTDAADPAADVSDASAAVPAVAPPTEARASHGSLSPATAPNRAASPAAGTGPCLGLPSLQTSNGSASFPQAAPCTPAEMLVAAPQTGFAPTPPAAFAGTPAAAPQATFGGVLSTFAVGAAIISTSFSGGCLQATAGASRAAASGGRAPSPAPASAAARYVAATTSVVAPVLGLPQRPAARALQAPVSRPLPLFYGTTAPPGYLSAAAAAAPAGSPTEATSMPVSVRTASPVDARGALPEGVRTKSPVDARGLAAMQLSAAARTASPVETQGLAAATRTVVRTVSPVAEPIAVRSSMGSAAPVPTLRLPSSQPLGPCMALSGRSHASTPERARLGAAGTLGAGAGVTRLMPAAFGGAACGAASSLSAPPGQMFSPRLQSGPSLAAAQTLGTPRLVLSGSSGGSLRTGATQAPRQAHVIAHRIQHAV